MRDIMTPMNSGVNQNHIPYVVYKLYIKCEDYKSLCMDGNTKAIDRCDKIDSCEGVFDKRIDEYRVGKRWLIVDSLLLFLKV